MRVASLLSGVKAAGGLTCSAGQALVLEVQEASLTGRLSIFVQLLASVAVASDGDTDAEADSRAGRLLGLGRRRDLPALLAVEVAADLSVEREDGTVKDLLIQLIYAKLDELPKLEDAL